MEGEYYQLVSQHDYFVMFSAKYTTVIHLTLTGPLRSELNRVLRFKNEKGYCIIIQNDGTKP